MFNFPNFQLSYFTHIPSSRQYQPGAAEPSSAHSSASSVEFSKLLRIPVAIAPVQAGSLDFLPHIQLTSPRPLIVRKARNSNHTGPGVTRG